VQTTQLVPSALKTLEEQNQRGAQDSAKLALNMTLKAADLMDAMQVYLEPQQFTAAFNSRRTQRARHA
jgi:hypothetical protein